MMRCYFSRWMMSAGSRRFHKALGGGERGPCRRKNRRRRVRVVFTARHHHGVVKTGEGARARTSRDSLHRGASHRVALTPQLPTSVVARVRGLVLEDFDAGPAPPARSPARSSAHRIRWNPQPTGDERPDRHVRLSFSAPLHRPHRVANGPHTPARGRIGALRLHTNAGRWRRALAPHLGELVWGERRGRGVWDASCALPGTPRLGTDLKHAIFERTHRSPVACAKNRFVSRRSPTQIIDRRSAVG